MIKKSKYTLSPNKIPYKISAEKQSEPTVRLEKSFKKKDHFFENRTASPQKTLVKTFRKHKQNQEIRELSPNNLNKKQRKSPIVTKQVSKISLKDDIYKTKQSMTSTSKLKIISDVLLKQVESQPCLIIQEIYERNSKFNQLLSEWQRKQMYDQTDRLIYQLNQFYTSLLEQVLYKSACNLQKTLTKYQETLKELQVENSQLRKSKQIYEKSEEYIQILKDKLNEYYEKSQWATIFFNSFTISNMDLQEFIKKNLLNNQFEDNDTQNQVQFEEIQKPPLKLVTGDQLLQAYANRKIKSDSYIPNIEKDKMGMHSQRFFK